MESGIISVNNVVISDPRIPFGGIKQSGFGRELSRYGLRDAFDPRQKRKITKKEKQNARAIARNQA